LEGGNGNAVCIQLKGELSLADHALRRSRGVSEKNPAIVLWGVGAKMPFGILPI